MREISPFCEYSGSEILGKFQIIFECTFAGERCSKENKLDEKQYNEDMYIQGRRQDARSIKMSGDQAEEECQQFLLSH